MSIIIHLKIRKILLYGFGLIILFALTNCYKTQTKKRELEVKYKIKSLVYFLGKNDHIDTIEYKLPVTRLINRSSAPQYIFANANDNISETSIFSGEIDKFFKHQNDTSYVDVPKKIEYGKIILDDVKWPLVSIPVKKKSSNDFKKKIEVPPSNTLDLSVVAIMEKISISCIITLLDSKNIEFTFHCKWKGERLLNQREEYMVFPNN